MHLKVTVSPLDKQLAIYRVCGLGYLVLSGPAGDFEIRHVESRDEVEHVLAQAGIAFTVQPSPPAGEYQQPNPSKE